MQEIDYFLKKRTVIVVTCKQISVDALLPAEVIRLVLFQHRLGKEKEKEYSGHNT